MVFIPGPSDPFIEFMRPPPDETPPEMESRLKRERDAQRVSDSIDEEIKQDRANAKKQKDIIKVLLLGQSESGKSTTLKNFLMRYAKDDWERERNGWRSVVQLNIVRTITTILKVVESELNGDAVTEDEGGGSGLVEGGDIEPLEFTGQHRLPLIRLAPLRAVEAELRQRLGAGTEPVPPALSMSATPFGGEYPSLKRRSLEFSVRSWQEVIDCHAHRLHPEEIDSATLTIAGCQKDMQALWDDKNVRLALKRRKLRLLDSAGFFLNDLERIATRNYAVSDDDIVRARLRTVGIQEHRIKFPSGTLESEKSSVSIYYVVFRLLNGSLETSKEGWEWRIYDVGGCRTSRAAWLPFFENVNVIIFLSPVSVFDQRLDEDPRVNRLEDSLILWTSICSSKLLARTQLILFLNKCDLLRRKLKRGVKLSTYLPSYGDRPNEVIPVVKYFREKFKDIQKVNSLEARSIYIYPTTVTDTEATAVTLGSVRDGVLRENLADSQLI